MESRRKLDSLNFHAMEHLKYYDQYRSTRIEIARLAMRMAELHRTGHDSEQSDEYEAAREAYLQRQVDLLYIDFPGHSHSHFTTG